MVEYFTTVRELIQKADWDLLVKEFAEIEGKDLEEYKDRLLSSYQGSVAELFKMSEGSQANPEDLVISFIEAGEDTFNDEDYIDVAIRNSKFVEDPQEGLSAWGGNSKDKNDCPEGSYNCNWYGYQRVYGISGTDLVPLLDGKIFFADEETEARLKDKDAELLAAILFEFTFNGFTHEERQEFVDEIRRRIESIKDGTAELFTPEEVRQKLLGSEPTVVQYQNPLKKNESEREGR